MIPCCYTPHSVDNPRVKGTEARLQLNHCPIKTRASLCTNASKRSKGRLGFFLKYFVPSVCVHVKLFRDLKGTKTAQKRRHCESTSQCSLLYNPSRGPSAIFVPGYASRLGIFSGD